MECGFIFEFEKWCEHMLNIKERKYYFYSLIVLAKVLFKMPINIHLS